MAELLGIRYFELSDSRQHQGREEIDGKWPIVGELDEALSVVIARLRNYVLVRSEEVCRES